MPKSNKLQNIIAAQAVTERVFRKIVGMLKAGVTEQEIAGAIERLALEYGASKLAFPSIVGSGPNGAKPHAVPGSRKLKQGDLVVVDLGVMVGGYCSDMTRTAAVGRPSAEAQKVYEVVRRAQRAAIRAARPGMTGRELDTVARDVIEQAGYGKRFIHALGHGVGRKIHQNPRLSQKRNHRLKVGDVVTIEPGIYIPGRFGVRIEDMVLLTKTGCRNLTRTPATLRVR